MRMFVIAGLVTFACVVIVFDDFWFGIILLLVAIMIGTIT